MLNNCFLVYLGQDIFTALRHNEILSKISKRLQKWFSQLIWFQIWKWMRKDYFLFVFKKKIFCRLVGVWLQSLQNVLKWPPKMFPKEVRGREFFRKVLEDKKNDIVSSFWTTKNFLVETFSQLSQQIRRFLITEMNFCEKIKLILALLPTLLITQ